MESSQAPENSVGARILVVEDDRASRSAMVSLLRLSGHEPVSAGMIAEALDRLSASPAYVILDLMLPDGNGAQILAHIHHNRLPTRVIVTTGAIEWQKMLDAAPVKPDLLLQKPIDFKQLLAWIERDRQRQ